MFRRFAGASAALGLAALLCVPAALAGPGAAAATPATASQTAVSHALARVQSVRSDVKVSDAALRHSADTQTITQSGDPTDVAENPVNEPRAAIVKSTANYTTTSLTLSLTPAQYTDPLTDPNWLSNSVFSSLVFGFFSPQSPQTAFAVVYAAGIGLVMGQGQNGGGASVSCPGLTDDLGQTTQSYSVTIPDSCFGTPSQLSWIAILSYDPVPNDDGSNAVSDFVPDNGNLLVVSPTAGATEGYWLFARDGGVFSEGNANFFGSTGGIHLKQPIVTAAATPTTPGYLMVASDGGVFAFGGAQYHGSLGGISLRQPIVAMAETPKDDGYWLFARDGGVFNFGSAKFYGSLGSVHLKQPIVAAFAAPGGTGYTLIAADGGVFNFGSAQYHGSLGGHPLKQPIVAAAPSPAGDGYWLFAGDGGVFSFGDAQFLGSLGSIHLSSPIVDAAPADSGYRLVASDGGVFCFGAAYEGSEGGVPLRQPIVAMATAD